MKGNKNYITQNPLLAAQWLQGLNLRATYHRVSSALFILGGCNHG